MNEKGLPFKGFSEKEKKSIKYIISDVDDTITKEGKLYPHVLEAIWRAKISGRTIILVTGGSVGWADCYIRQWPIDAVIAESGAVMLCHDKDGSILQLLNPQIDKETVMKKRRNLLEYTSCLPFSSDQCARFFDIAYDKKKMDSAEIKALKKTLIMYGANFAESSIHINAWFGPYNKKSALKFFMEERLGIKEEEYLRSSIYLGDSFNDQPLFDYIPLSIGMHTVEDQREKFDILPKYITKGTSGDGWYEVVHSLLKIRKHRKTQQENSVKEEKK